MNAAVPACSTICLPNSAASRYACSCHSAAFSTGSSVSGSMLCSHRRNADRPQNRTARGRLRHRCRSCPLPQGPGSVPDDPHIARPAHSCSLHRQHRSAMYGPIHLAVQDSSKAHPCNNLSWRHFALRIPPQLHKPVEFLFCSAISGPANRYSTRSRRVYGRPYH